MEIETFLLIQDEGNETLRDQNRDLQDKSRQWTRGKKKISGIKDKIEIGALIKENVKSKKLRTQNIYEICYTIKRPILKIIWLGKEEETNTQNI